MGRGLQLLAPAQALLGAPLADHLEKGPVREAEAGITQSALTVPASAARLQTGSHDNPASHHPEAVLRHVRPVCFRV